MASRKKSGRSVFSRRVVGAAVTAMLAAPAVGGAAVTLTKNGNTSWTMSNGQLTAVFQPGGDKITSVQLKNGTTSPNLLSQLDQEFAGTPFGGGPQTFGSQVGPNGSYVDVWATTGESQNASGGLPMTQRSIATKC